MFENPDVSGLLSLHQWKMPLYTKIQNLEEEIATLHHKKLISKKLETAEMSLTGVLEAIFETEEGEEKK